MSVLSKLVRNNALFCRISLPLYFIKNFFQHELYLSDEKYLRKLYERKMGRRLNLDNPVSFSEKLQWLKLYDRSPEHTLYADKLKLKSVVAHELGDGYTPETYFVTRSPSDLTLDKISRYPAVIKTNHDQGSVYILKEPSELELSRIRNELRISLSKNLYWCYREWQYKNIDRRIYIEECIENLNSPVDEFKFHMANGNCILILHKRSLSFQNYYNWYAPDWTHLDISRPGHLQGNPVAPPPQLHEMMEMSKTLAQRFKFARVDLYKSKNKPMVGEITFHPAAGLKTFTPESFNSELGSRVTL